MSVLSDLKCKKVIRNGRGYKYAFTKRFVRFYRRMLVVIPANSFKNIHFPEVAIKLEPHIDMRSFGITQDRYPVLDAIICLYISFHSFS
jgi:hypothetical protein